MRLEVLEQRPVRRDGVLRSVRRENRPRRRGPRTSESHSPRSISRVSGTSGSSSCGRRSHSRAEHEHGDDRDAEDDPEHAERDGRRGRGHRVGGRATDRWCRWRRRVARREELQHGRQRPRSRPTLRMRIPNARRSKPTKKPTTSSGVSTAPRPITMNGPAAIETAIASNAVAPSSRSSSASHAGLRRQSTAAPVATSPSRANASAVIPASRNTIASPCASPRKRPRTAPPPCRPGSRRPRGQGSRCPACCRCGAGRRGAGRGRRRARTRPRQASRRCWRRSRGRARRGRARRGSRGPPGTRASRWPRWRPRARR